VNVDEARALLNLVNEWRDRAATPDAPEELSYVLRECADDLQLEVERIGTDVLVVGSGFGLTAQPFPTSSEG